MYVLVWNKTKLTSWPQQHAEDLIEFLKNKANKYDGNWVEDKNEAEAT